jgi:uncharacterized membrane protein YhaH (DUF805 family)
MTWSQFLFSFEGRIGRAWFWFFGLAATVFYCGLFLLWGMATVSTMGPEGPGAGAGIAGVVVFLLSLTLIWPAFAVQAKRWHDVDKSAWWILLGFVPIGNIVALVFTGFIPGTPGPNRFGDPPA